MQWQLILVVAFLSISVPCSQANPLVEEQFLNTELSKYSEKDNADAKLTVPELIVKYGYPVEIHEITTADGYILTVHRIPFGKDCGPAENKKVVWLQHGLLGDSSNWIINGVSKGLAYLLADTCYDVWMGNARGNTYSKKHVNMSATDNEFWQYSWHEMGIYDVPADIDYALSQTGQSSLYWFGHSMGTTMFFVCMSERPEYNSKVRLMSALAPVSFVEHMISPIRYIAPFSTSIEWILNMLGPGEFLPTSPLMEFLGATVCHQQSPIQSLCSNVLFLVAGFNADQLDRELLPVIMGHTPSGASVRSLVHYAQGVNSKKFRQYDHGTKKNKEIYGTADPPDYNISNIVAPVALYWGENDWLGVKSDVYRLAELLPNLVRKFRCAHDKFNHFDFIWAIDANPLLNKPIMDLLPYF